jgi:hypothetical protein
MKKAQGSTPRLSIRDFIETATNIVVTLITQLQICRNYQSIQALVHLPGFSANSIVNVTTRFIIIAVAPTSNSAT